MKKFKNNQKGLSMFGFLFVGLFVVIIGLFGFQIGIGYMTQFTIKKALAATFLELKGSPSETPSGIKNLLLKKLEPDSIDLNGDDLVITKDSNGGFNVDIAYIKEVEFSKKIKLVIDLSFSQASEPSK